jgi:hypothetical protein
MLHSLSLALFFLPPNTSYKYLHVLLYRHYLSYTSTHRGATKPCLDKGWKEKYGIWCKGYSTNCRIEDLLLDIVDVYNQNGKWYIIYQEQIFHPELRKFSVHSNGTDFTNYWMDLNIVGKIIVIRLQK